MNDAVSKEKTLKDLSIITDDINQLLSNASNIDKNWNDVVGIEYKKRIDKVIDKKKNLLYELKKFEDLVKKSNI